jgi:hypothetical protein
MTEEPTDPQASAVVAAALRAVEAGDSAGALAIATANADPQMGAARIAALAKQLYRDKNVSAMIAVGEAGMRFCLDAARRATDPAVALALKTRARGLAYNIAANCWPGWGDDGIVIEAAHLRSGLALARLSRDLVQELGLGERATGTAHWLIGALHLAAGRSGDALSDFQRAEEAYRADDDRSYRLMALGYAALARKAAPSSHAAGVQDLAEALRQLREHGSTAAIFFADQIDTADWVLSQRSAKAR